MKPEPDIETLGSLPFIKKQNNSTKNPTIKTL